jgi:hypothetical protein
MSLRTFRQQIRRLERTTDFNGFHLIYAYVGTPDLKLASEEHIASETALAKRMRKLPFVFRLNASRQPRGGEA